MNNNSFKQISEREKRAILLGVIASKTNGKLSKDELENIVSKLDVKIQYHIKILTDAKEFSKILTLKNSTDKHSWAGHTKDLSSGEVLLGVVLFGEDYWCTYSDNGNQTECNERKSAPDFNINDKIVVRIEEYNFSNFNNNYYENWKNSIFIYLPGETPYEVDKEVQYILDNFKL